MIRSRWSWLLFTAVTLTALPVSAIAQDATLPPSGDAAKEALENSPRHGEFAFIPLPNSDVKLRTWISYPERSDKAPVIVVIHEIFGMSDWIRSVADALAANGYIAVAPDLISGMEGAEENPRETIGRLEPPEAVARLNAALDYGLNLPAANGKCAAIGFCWGGTTNFRYATAQPKLDAAVVYYGTSPDAASLAKLSVPVLGLYGEMDERVVSTIAPAEEELKRLGKPYEKAIYAGAGHGFLRQQDGRDGANLKASQDAWPRTLAFLKDHTGG